MTIESSIGFGLAFLMVAWAVSAVLGSALLAGRARLARFGPAAERSAAAAVLILGPIVGLLAVLSLTGHSLAGAWLGVADHCADHGHHPHLCWIHGSAWASDPVAVVLLAMVGAFALVRAVQKLTGLWLAGRALGRLDRVARPGPGGVLIAPADRVLCFAAGVRRPRVYASSAAWQLLDEDERRAVLAHEHAHLAQGDIWRGACLGILALLGAPILARHVLSLWRGATERLCDARAAAEVDAGVVANALVVLARAGAGAPATTIPFASPAGMVGRVEALLGSIPAGGRAAGRIVRGLWLFVGGCAIAMLAFADPLHHALETLLGVF